MPFVGDFHFFDSPQHAGPSIFPPMALKSLAGRSQRCGGWIAYILIRGVSDDEVRHQVEGRFLMAFFDWKDNMSVGNQVIDVDHRKLIQYLNEMQEAMIAGHGKDIVGTILNRLVAYTHEHFAREELIWKSGHYAGFEKHKKEHGDLLKTVTEFKAKYDKGTIALSVDVMNFLRDWLKNHILKSDKEAAAAIAATAHPGAAKPAAAARPTH